MRKVLITGALGQIAEDIISVLGNSYKLRLCHYREPEKVLTHEFLKADMRNPEDLKRAVEGCDAIVHLAGKGAKNPFTIEPFEASTVNSIGTLNMLEAGVKNKVKKFIFASSLGIYGCRIPEDIPPEYFPIDEKHPLRPKSGYGLSKILAEKICEWYACKHNISVISLRIGAVRSTGCRYSTHSIKPGISDEQLADNLHLTLWNHVDGRDVGQVVRLSLESNLSGFETFNITAEDHLLTIPSMELIQKFYPEVKMIYNKDGFVTNGDKSFYDISKAKKMLGFHPEYSFKRYHDWIKKGKAESDYYNQEEK